MSVSHSVCSRRLKMSRAWSLRGTSPSPSGAASPPLPDALPGTFRGDRGFPPAAASSSSGSDAPSSLLLSSARPRHHPYTFSMPSPVIMPSTGGKCAYEWKHAVMKTVATKSKMTSTAPGSNCTATSPSTLGGTASLIRLFISAAGTSQFTTAGAKSPGNSSSRTFPFCQTISVVKSPKGEKAPPAFAATTMLTQHIATYSSYPCPRLLITAPMSTAVVRLSAMGESQKAMRPVIQKQLR
mmetsp:Transcript_8682/g.38335  ORF Transcript_8682/g.38335 Transcript_8682/m.38335 type:complete len:240 (+) Transcript_8682:876-1595(+)